MSSSNSSKGTFTYKRFMRDGSVKEITALLNNPEKRRTGKTERERLKGKQLSRSIASGGAASSGVDKANTKRTKA